MKTIFSCFILFLICFKSLSQTPNVNDTVSSNIVIKFNTVKQSFKEASTSTMNTYYLPHSKSVVLTFEVPSFNFRLNSSLNDSAVFKSSSSKLTLQNKVESFVKEDQITYSFTFITSKDNLVKMLSDKLSEITFYFTPNQYRITEYLEANNQMTASLKKHFIRISGKTVKYIVSKPDKVQYEKLIAWLIEL
jgi:hypothetical protein